jgi:vacuolar-type H+-ATPase catalytic subunit A/Vma1
MPSSARLRSCSTFLRSLNVEQDGTNPHVLSSYSVTPNALRTTRRILDALLRADGGAWTITGAFGTGKSAFLIFLADLLGRSEGRGISRSQELLRGVAPELAAGSLREVQRKHNLAPIMVSGSAEPITSAILRSLLEANRKALLALTPKLKRRMRTLAAMQSRRTTSNTRDLIDIVEEVSANGLIRKGQPQGILLLVDELGKLLEYAAKHPHESDPFVLQQLAEIAARSQGRLLVVAALHQDFRAYANNLPLAERAEWEKIRGRFEDIAFEEPPDQLLRFVARAWSRIRQSEALHVDAADDEKARSLAPRLWDHDLVPRSLTEREGLELFGDCAPLHPLVALILGPLFRRVGQNERSAFTFLASLEPRALHSWLRQRSPDESGLFDVVDLYGYLISSLGTSLLNTADAKRWAEAFEAEARHPELGPEEIAVTRSVAILSTASRWFNVKASPKIVEFALSERVTAKQVKTALRCLESMSLLVHRRYNDSYALWEGSDVDIEARLTEGKQRLMNKGNVAAILRRYYSVRPVLARRHSFRSGTLRFFAVDFVTTEELQKAELSASDGCDGQILVVLPKNTHDQQAAVEATKYLSKNTVARILDAEGRFADYAFELAAADWVRHNTPELSHDPTARRELYARTVSLHRSLDQLILEVLYGSSRVHGDWYYLGTRLPIGNARALNEKLSAICDERFCDAPRIDNEIINRRQLSSAAAAARRNLIQKMIEASDQPELGLAGDPPERSIYRSLLGAEGGLALHIEVDGIWAFREPSSDSQAIKVFDKIDQFFDQTVDTPGTVTKLFELLRRPPFGLRDGPIPVLICAAFLMREADIALYENGIFCPSLTAATMDRLVKSPERFTIRKWQLSGVRKHLFEELERMVLGREASVHSKERRLLRVVRPLLHFISSLPQYAMQTADLSPQTRAIRNAFQQATEPDILLFESLPGACGLPPFSASQRASARSTDVSAYVAAIKSTFRELHAAYPRLLESIRQSLKEGFGLSSGTPSLREALQADAANLLEFVVEPDLNLFLSRILDRDSNEDAWLEGVASFLCERPVVKWRDEDRAHFNVRLRQFVRRTRLLEATVADRPARRSAKSVDSIRLSLTGTSFGQIDYSVHLDKASEKKIQRIQTLIEDAVSGSPDPTVAIGALCRVLKSRLQESTPVQGGTK